MSTDEIENKLREDRRRIITLENDVGALKVDVGKVSVTLEHAEKRAEERHAGLKTAQLEIRDLIQRRIEMDQEREKDAREYRQERERAERLPRSQAVPSHEAGPRGLQRLSAVGRVGVAGPHRLAARGDERGNRLSGYLASSY